MRAVALVPACALLAGSAGGLAAPDLTGRVAPALLCAACACAVYAWRFARAAEVALWVAVAFGAGGGLLAADAWTDAAESSLRHRFALLEADAVRHGRAQGIPVPEEPGIQALVTGVLRADASPRDSGVSLVLDVTSLRAGGVDYPVSGGASVIVGGELVRGREREWRRGRTIRLPAHLRRPSRYLNPGARDEERASLRRGIALVGSAKSGALVEVLGAASWLEEAAAHARRAVRDAVERHVARWSPRASGVVTAILIGDRAGLSPQTTTRLQEAGTYHVIAISGGNIAILAALALTGFRVAGVLGRTAMLCAIAGLVAYWHLVGGGPSVSRATLMAVLYFAARAGDLRADPVNALAVAAALFVVAEPLAAADAGFLLTVGATTGLLLIATRVPVATRSRALAAAAGLLLASASAEIALMPIGAALFERVTFAGLILNFAAVPLMAIVQGAGMMVVGLSALVPPAASVAGRLAAAAADGLVRSADLVELMPSLTWRVAVPHPAMLLVYYTALLGAMVPAWIPVLATGKVRRVRQGAIGLAGITFVIIAFEPLLRRPLGDGRLHVMFLDVGQGDATLIRFPNGFHWLVDAGGLPSGTFDVGERVVAPALRRAGVSRLDTLVVTHGDADHLGGAEAVLTEFRPRDVWEGIPVPPHAALRALRVAADARVARWVNVQANDRLAVGGVDVYVRHPPVPDWERQDVRNDDSIVLELRWRDVSLVLPGDIGRETEAALAGAFPPAPLRIVKVPHHGSRGSSLKAFVEALDSDVAIASAGRSNTFGHPAEEVITRYAGAGSHVFRTDLDGAVRVVTDGTTIQVETSAGRTSVVLRD